MKGDNVIEFAAHRRRAAPEDAATPNVERDSHRANETDALLRKLRDTKRLDKADQSALVGNLGRMIVQLDAKNPKVIAKNILHPNQWEKRTRYIRWPGEVAGRSARHAASGGDFARIIEQLIDQKVSRRFDHDQAKIQTVRDALKGTSFQPPSRFQMPTGDDDADTAYLVVEMEKVLDKLARDADLTEHFKLVSKHPIYPNHPYYTWSRSLELKSDLEPNSLYTWDWYTDDDELHDWIPWWAPKCVIGHLYIPFERRCLHLPDHVLSEVTKTCGGTVTRDTWMEHDCSSLIDPFVAPEWIRPRRVCHRLPIWLIALPLPNKLVPCLYAAIEHPGGFYPKQTFPSYDDPVSPCFVDTLGERVDNDAVYFCDVSDDDYESYYVHASETGIIAIGSRIDGDVGDFKPTWFCVSSIDEIPQWLQAHPVQQVLKLTMDSDAAQSFALLPRRFPGRRHSDSETIFRPAFSDSFTQTQLRQDTIAAYLLRNFGAEQGAPIFQALKEDALAKAAAAREIIDRGLAKFKAAFDSRYGK